MYTKSVELYSTPSHEYNLFKGILFNQIGQELENLAPE
jgi:hypothetical protein